MLSPGSLNHLPIDSLEGFSYHGIGNGGQRWLTLRNLRSQNVRNRLSHLRKLPLRRASSTASVFRNRAICALSVIMIS